MVLEKPSITNDQLVSASEVARDFSKIRKRAKDVPQYILDRGKIDTVIISYDQYEKMYMRLQKLEEENTELLVLKRSKELRENPDIAVSRRDVRRNSESNVIKLGYLNQQETKAILDYKKKLADKLGPELIKIGLYGSKARGDFNSDSDIDLLVVIKNRTSMAKEIIYDALLDINALYDIYNISVHIYTDEEYKGLANQPLSIPFLENYLHDEVQI